METLKRKHRRSELALIDSNVAPWSMCRLSAAMDPAFSKPFPPEFLPSHDLDQLPDPLPSVQPLWRRLRLLERLRRRGDTGAGGGGGGGALLAMSIKKTGFCFARG